MFTTSLIILGIGIVFLAMAGISFRLRAVFNKPAWNGATLPFLWIGLIFALIGGAMVAIFYSPQP
jgi:uncharacterized integral membrane protein